MVQIIQIMVQTKVNHGSDNSITAQKTKPN